MRIRRIVASSILLVAAAFASSSSLGQGRAGGGIEADLDEAQKAFEDKNWDKAIERYQTVIGKAPQESAVAYWKLATIYLAVKKDARAALRICDQGEAAIPDSGDIKKQKGIVLLALKRSPEAVRALEAALAASQPPSITYDADVFLCQLQAKVDCQKAIIACTSFLNTRPGEMARNDVAARIHRGQALNLCRRYLDALQDFDAALKAAPRTTVAQLGKFEALFRNRDCGRAATLGEELRGQGLAPKNPIINFGLARCSLEFRHFNEAVSYARAYIEQSPTDIAGHLVLGDAYRARGDHGNAIVAYRGALGHDPTNAEALTRMGDALLATNRVTEARDTALQVLRGQPQNIDASVLLARAHMRLKQPKRAIEILEGLKGPLRTSQVLYTLGWAYHDAGELSVAVIRLDQAYQAGSRNAAEARIRVRNRLAGELLKENKLAEAEEILRTGQKHDPNNITTAQNLGLIRILRGDAGGAIQALEICHRRKPTDIVVNRLLGRAYLIARETDRALKYYEVAEKGAERIRGLTLGEVYAETAPLYLDAGQLDQAVQRLETADAEVRDLKLTPLIKANLAAAYFRRGVVNLKKKAADKAVVDLQRAVERRDFVKPADRATLHCALAFAYLSTGKAGEAIREFTSASQAGGCQLKAPYDRVGTEFFVAYAKYRDGSVSNVKDALAKFTKLAGRAQGPIGAIMKEIMRSSHEQLAVASFNRDDYREAANALRTAKKLGARGAALEHNLAVLELVQGRPAQAARQFESLGARPPEALMNLGIVYDHQGEPRKALELYQKAHDRGVRIARLRAWIDIKERLFGGGSAAGGAAERR